MTTEVRRFVPSADASGADVPATPANLRQPVVGMTTEVRRFDDVDDAVLAAAGAAVRPSDRMVIVHTSGSTSRPKGVIHQHGPLIEHLRVLNELRRYDEDEILYSASPFFWIGGFAYSLLGTLVAGATPVCSNATDASATLALLERTRPTTLHGFEAVAAPPAQRPPLPARDR